MICKVCLEEEAFCACAPDAIPTPNAMRVAFENEWLSVSRMKLYEQCPRAFFFRYVDKGATKPRGMAADFGTVLHATLEEMYRWIVEHEFSGIIPESLLIDCYRSCWQASGLPSVAMYQEGLAILRSYLRSHDRVDHMSILAIEQEFNIDIDGFVMNGFIDRVDKLDNESIAIIDYKSNRKLFTKDELEADIQMSIYGLAARRLYPWAKRVVFVFHMLRHDTHQEAKRTAERIDDDAGYIVALGRRTEDPENKFLPLLNANCSYCDHRGRCDEYARAIEGRIEVTRVANTEDFETVVVEREKLAKLAKAMYARKAELDDLIKAKISHDGEFVCAGVRYRMTNVFETSYPALEPVVRAFVDVGYDPRVVERRVVRVDKDAVEDLRVEAVQKVDRAKGMLLNATIAALAEKKPTTPRLDGHQIKTAKKADDVPGAATGDTRRRSRAKKGAEGTT